MTLKTMKVNKKGMVTIPNEIRKKYEIVEGSEVFVTEINGEIHIIPIIDFHQIRKLLPDREDMKKEYIKSKMEDLELEK
ncbi:MAG: AbrB/MazE/SpoVT family DNA-binding domain-containing protein [Promethearchaeia archaeon]